MMKKEMVEALNKQINVETYSGYLYLSMSAYLQDEGWTGMATWLQLQGAEEFTHANKLFSHLIERGERVKLDAIDAPPFEWKSPLDVFKAAYAHEIKVTGMINALVDMAQSQKDHATNSFLQWFVDEQVEEEAQSSDIVKKLEIIGEAKGGLFALDHHLAKRGKK